MSSHADISDLLVNLGQGDRSAHDKLLPLIEQELHRLAHTYMSREDPEHALQTTALINETYLRLVDQRKLGWQNRAHFFGIAAQIMRRILLNYALDKNRSKRGDQPIRVSFPEAAVTPVEQDRELIALNDALTRLEEIDERKSKVVELRFFGGLTIEEVGEVLKVPNSTVEREWRLAKAWLAREMQVVGELSRRIGSTSESLAFDRGVRPVMEIVLPEKAEAVIGFRADPELQAHIEELAQKSTEGELTDDERAEYAGYVRANKFVAILKRQAHQLSNSQS
jgi:RNA polymerase sigma factor (TIGR02999 family)